MDLFALSFARQLKELNIYSFFIRAFTVHVNNSNYKNHFKEVTVIRYVTLTFGIELVISEIGFKLIHAGN